MPGLNESCRICGKDANDACSGCKDALYCSKPCQKWDWKTGGHKVLCRGPDTNRKINKILRELFAAEWTWLQGLSFGDKERLFWDEALDMPMNHLFISGQVALVLARANACAALRGNNNQMLHEEYGFDYYEIVLKPWCMENMDFLSEQGFFVELITREVYVSDRECDCDSPCGNLSDTLGGSAALVKDIHSPKIGLVNSVFGMERPCRLAEWTEEEKSLTMDDLLDCATFRRSKEGNLETGSIVTYYFSHPKQVFGGESVCCSPCHKLPFNVDPSDADAVGNHFHKCYQALAKIGFLIEFVIVHIDDWDDTAIAEAWWAASGKDMSVFQGWFDNGTVLLSKRLSEERRDSVFDVVLEWLA